jgi:hypothetical protein
MNPQVGGGKSSFEAYNPFWACALYSNVSSISYTRPPDQYFLKAAEVICRF